MTPVSDPEWPEEIEEVPVDLYRAADAPPTAPAGLPPGDAGVGVFANHLWLALGQAPLLPLADDVTTHMVALEGLVREGADRRILFDDPSGDGTFLEEGRNTAGVRAKRYVHGRATGIWSVTFAELARVYRGGVMYHPGQPVRRSELRGWFVGHDVFADRVLAHVHGPACSFQLELHGRFIAASEGHGLVRWDVAADEGGYSLCFEAVAIPPHVNTEATPDVFQWYIFNWTAQTDPDRHRAFVARATVEGHWLLTHDYVHYAAVDGVSDPRGGRPYQGVYRICGLPDQLPEPFEADPIPVSDHLVYAVLVRRSNALVFALRGHRSGWTPRSLTDRLHKILLSVIFNT